MPKFTFTSPEGKNYDVDGPEGSTKEQAFGILQQQIGGAKPASKPAQSGMDFVSGNLNKGIANVLGAPMDVSRSVAESAKGLANSILGTHLQLSPPAPGGSESIQRGMAKAGLINQSAEPRSTGQRYGAAALQALPTAAIPGGGASMLGRVGAAAGSGLGGEAGKDIGGVSGQLVGSMAGGVAGGMAGLKGAVKGMEAPPVSEAARASKASGVPLTIGQESGNKALTAIENTLRELLPSRSIASADSNAQVVAGVKRVNELADQLNKGGTSAEAVGTNLEKAYTSTVNKIDGMRDAQAGIDYGKVRALAGDKPVIQYKSTLDELDKIIAQNKDVPAGDSKKIYEQAVGMRKMLAEAAPGEEASAILGASGKPLRAAQKSSAGAQTGTIDAAMKTRSAWGKAARRSGNVFNDVDPTANQLLAKRLFGAINRDFEAASTEGSPIGAALKEANANYAKSSKSIEFIQKSALGKLLGEEVTDAAFSGQTARTKAPEAIAAKYLSLEPSQAKQVTQILKTHAPEVLLETQAFVLRKGLDAAKAATPGQPAMAFGKFRKEIDHVQHKLSEMGFSDKAIADIKDLTDTMARAGDRTGANPSGTAQAAQMAALPGLALASPVSAVVSMVSPYAMSHALLTPRGRELIKTVVSGTTPVAKQAALSAIRSLYPNVAQQGQQ